MATLLKLARESMQDFVRPSNRTDRCSCCWHFDHVYRPRCVKDLASARESLARYSSRYWQHCEWPAREGDDPAARLEAQLRCSIAYISTHTNRFREEVHADTPYAQLLDLHQEEAHLVAALRERRTELECFQWHFSAVARQAAVAYTRERDLAAGVCYMRYDFKQCVSLPVGPDKQGLWFYPSFKNECSVLGVVLCYRGAGRVLERQCHTLLTGNVLTHSPQSACMQLRRVLEHIPAHVKVLDCWQDAGGHFRAYIMMYFLCCTLLLEESRFQEVWVNVDAEEHGKGSVDAHFGTLTHCLNEAKANRIVANAADFVPTS